MRLDQIRTTIAASQGRAMSLVTKDGKRYRIMNAGQVRVLPSGTELTFYSGEIQARRQTVEVQNIYSLECDAAVDASAAFVPLIG